MIVSTWINKFHRDFMEPAEAELSKLQKELFEVPWADCRNKLSADVEGSMAMALNTTAKLLNCDCCNGKKETENAD